MATLPDPDRCPRPWIASYPPGVPPTYRLPAVALPRLLDDAARDFPEHVALQYGERTLNYATVQRHVTALAAGLQTLPGQESEAPLLGARVLMRTGDGLSGPIVLFALWRVGAVAVPIGPELSLDEVAEVARATGATGLVGDPRFVRRVSLPGLRFVIEVLDDAWHARRFALAMRRLPARLDPRTWRGRGSRPIRAEDLPVESSAARDGAEPDAPTEGAEPAAPTEGAEPAAPTEGAEPAAPTEGAEPAAPTEHPESAATKAASETSDPGTDETLRIAAEDLLEAGAALDPVTFPSLAPDAPALAAVVRAAADLRRAAASDENVTAPPGSGDRTASRASEDGPRPDAPPTPRFDVVEHTHRTLLATAFQTRLWIPDVQAGRERVLVAEPTHDLVGNAVGLLSSVLAGATTILMEHDASLGKAIERTEPTLLIVRAPRVDRLLLEDESGRRDLTSLRVCLLVGGGLHRHKAKEFERRAAGARVRHLHGWGATVPITHGQPVYGRIEPTRHGLPVTSTVAAVVDPDDPATERELDQPGRLIVHGPQVPGGGWALTDLIATVDGDGWFTVIGQDDEVVDVAGKVRSPARITNELLAHPHVRDAEVVDVDGELVAAVSPARRKRPDPVALREALAFHLDVRALPDGIVVVDDLPKVLRSTGDAEAVERGRAQLCDQIRAAREAESVHTGAEADANGDPDAPPAADPAGSGPADEPRTSP